MQAANGNNHFRLDSPSWNLLDEFSVSDKLIDGNQEANLSQELNIEAIEELGLPVAHINRIRGAITKAAKNANKHKNQVGSTLPVIIRLFIENRSKQGPPHPDIEAMHVTNRERQGLPSDFTLLTHQSHHLEGHLADGWGYFLIERYVNHPSIPTQGRHYSIELYLYSEGKQN